jgi:hypothetical protein
MTDADAHAIEEVFAWCLDALQLPANVLLVSTVGVLQNYSPGTPAVSCCSSRSVTV